MKLQADDPRLTAFVLGELSENEQAEIEAALKDPENASVLAAVEELKQTTALLVEALGEESRQDPGLSRSQKQALFEAGEKPTRSWDFRRLAWNLSTAVVATGLIGVLVVYVFGDNLREPFSSSSNALSGMEPPRYRQPAVSSESKYHHKCLKTFGTPLSQVGATVPDGTEAGNGIGGLGKVGTKGVLGLLSRSQPADGSGRFAGVDKLAIDGHRRQAEYEPGEFHTEAYDHITDNPFQRVSDHPLSTFSIDVDTASYANVRRMLKAGQLPPPGAVRIEELVNYFNYDYPQPSGKHPFSVTVELARAPWSMDHRLMRVGLKGREIPWENRPRSNLVFLIDVSGSMSDVNKLPLLKQSLKLLVDKLDERDRVAIAVYAGAAGMVLPSTTCDRKRAVEQALERLESGGSTNGGAGIRLAYATALENFIQGGNNRVVLATDGDFNVGTTSQDELVRLVEKKAKQGVFLTVLGFGMGNYKDATLEQLADRGNGNYAYIDTLKEARKVLVHQVGGTMLTIAKDVKIQIEFNPANVQAYRLIGYENRLLAKEDFNDDTKDAGEIGAGHTVTALYELVPVGAKLDLPGVDELKYQPKHEEPISAHAGELLTVKLRYKQPDEDKSTLLTLPVEDDDRRLSQASRDFQFAAAVAAFGMLLRDSPHKGNASFDQVIEFAQTGQGRDPFGYRAEFIELARMAKRLK